MKGSQFTQHWPKLANIETNVTFYGAAVAFFCMQVTNYNAFLTFYVTSIRNYNSQVAYYGV